MIGCKQNHPNCRDLGATVTKGRKSFTGKLPVALFPKAHTVRNVLEISGVFRKRKRVPRRLSMISPQMRKAHPPSFTCFACLKTCECKALCDVKEGPSFLSEESEKTQVFVPLSHITLQQPWTKRVLLLKTLSALQNVFLRYWHDN